jgi:dihydrodipicolinate synthase/N-acetylneuraminate lyase
VDAQQLPPADDRTSPRPALPALVTPLTADGRIHTGDVTALVTRALADGAAGVLVAGSTGEGALLTPDQRVEVTRVARAAGAGGGGGRPLLLAGASAPTVEGLVADVTALAEAGADEVLVLAPSTYPLRPEEVVACHLDVAGRTGVPTLVYHFPAISGSSLTADTVRELAGHANVVGMKDSSPDADRRAAFVAATRTVADFRVFTGHAPTLRAALTDDADGSITAIANVRLPQVLALHRAVAAGDAAAAATAQSAATATADALASVGRSNPAVLKAALQLEGVIEERWCRPPLGSVPPGRLDHVRTALMR